MHLDHGSQLCFKQRVGDMFHGRMLVDVPYELVTLSDYIYGPAVSMWCIDIWSMA